LVPRQRDEQFLTPHSCDRDGMHATLAPERHTYPVYSEVASIDTPHVSRHNVHEQSGCSA
jgi:hypothetical protein